MAGDAESGVAIMQMGEGLDTGPVLHEVRTAITERTTAQSLHDDLAQAGAQAMSEVLARLAAGTARWRQPPQPEAGVTYAEKISKPEARIDFTRSAHEVLRHVHGLSPFPGAWCMVPSAGKPVRVKLLEVEVEPSICQASPVKCWMTGSRLAAAAGAIRPVRLQREGKGPMDLAAFLNGLRPAPGTRLE
jgi:methionyl-tRNA formyltransferase